MAKIATSRNPFCLEILEALGLKHVVSLDLRMAVGEIVTATVKFYPEEDAMKKLPAIFKKYRIELHEITPKPWQPGVYWLAEEVLKRKETDPMVAWYASGLSKLNALNIVYTPVASEALRFGTQEECQQWIDSLNGISEEEKAGLKPVEHMFIAEEEEKPC